MGIDSTFDRVICCLPFKDFKGLKKSWKISTKLHDHINKNSSELNLTDENRIAYSNSENRLLTRLAQYLCESNRYLRSKGFKGFRHDVGKAVHVSFSISRLTAVKPHQLNSIFRSTSVFNRGKRKKQLYTMDTNILNLQSISHFNRKWVVFEQKSKLYLVLWFQGYEN